MTATRSQIMTALLNLLAGSGEFKLVGLRNRDPESIPTEQTPALFLFKHKEEIVRQSPSQPPKRILDFFAVLYSDVGQDENAIPALIIDDLLDGIDAVMRPDSPTLGRNTLGGLVFSAMIDGETTLFAGDVTGRGGALVPIRVIMP